MLHAHTHSSASSASPRLAGAPGAPAALPLLALPPLPPLALPLERLPSEPSSLSTCSLRVRARACADGGLGVSQHA